MIYDTAAAHFDRIGSKVALLRDSDELPSSTGLDWPALASVEAVTTARTLEAFGKKKLAAAFRKLYREKVRGRVVGRSPVVNHEKLFAPDDASLLWLPPDSFSVAFRFELEQPMMTRDDNLYTVSDNAVRKDRAFGWPHLAASSWKGAFRNALFQFGIENPKETREPSVVRLFGSAGDEDGKGASAGRLHFHPTFFHRVSFQMLNPQSRRTRSGKVPVEMEIVPAGERGWFHLRYVPFGALVPGEASEDWRVASHLIRAVMLDLGFGAKVSLGFGLAKDKVEDGGQLRIVSEQGLQTLPFTKISDLPLLQPIWWKENA